MAKKFLCCTTTIVNNTNVYVNTTHNISTFKQLTLEICLSSHDNETFLQNCLFIKKNPDVGWTNLKGDCWNNVVAMEVIAGQKVVNC